MTTDSTVLMPPAQTIVDLHNIPTLFRPQPIRSCRS